MTICQAHHPMRNVWQCRQTHGRILVELITRAGKQQDLVRWHQGSRRSLLRKLVGMTYGTHRDGIES